MAGSAIQGGRRTGVSGQHNLGRSPHQQLLARIISLPHVRHPTSASPRHAVTTCLLATTVCPGFGSMTSRPLSVTSPSRARWKPSKPELVLSSSTGVWPSDSSTSRNNDVGPSRGNYCDSSCALAHILVPGQADSANAGSQSTSSNGSPPGAADIIDSHALAAL
ncbi:hypothetical protein ARSEF4850_005989 [Beauveria asiatica]